MVPQTTAARARQEGTPTAPPATVEWEQTLPQVTSRFVLTDEVLYVGARGLLAGLDPETGEFRWRKSPTGDTQDIRTAGEEAFAITGQGGVSPESYQLQRVGPDGSTAFRFPAEPVDRELSIVATTDDTLYLASFSSDVVRMSGEPFHALNRQTGAERWRIETASGADATVAGSAVVVHGRDHIDVREAGTGERRWGFPTEGDRERKSLSFLQYIVRDGTVYARYDVRLNGDYRSEVVTFDLDTGAQRWTYKEDPGHVTVVDGVVYVTGGEELLALDADDGTERWRVSEPTELLRKTVVGDTLVTSWDDDTLRAYRHADGTPIWSKQFRNRTRFFVSSDEDTLYITNQGVGIRAANPADGSERWRWTRDGFQGVSPLRYVRRFGTESAIFALVGEPDAESDGTPRATIYRIDAETGTAEWSHGIAGDLRVRGVGPDRTILLEQHLKRGEATVQALRSPDEFSTSGTSTDRGLDGFGPLAAGAALVGGAAALLGRRSDDDA